MKHISVPLAALLLVAGVALAKPPARVSAAQLKAEIQAIGAQAVLLRYYDKPAWSASVMPGIKSAAPTWLTVAEQLKSAADGAGSEDLDLALYEALETAPVRVLPLLSRVHGRSYEELCNVSFEAKVPKRGVGAYLKNIRARFAAARTEEQRAMATACQRGLDQSQATAASQGLR